MFTLFIAVIALYQVIVPSGSERVTVGGVEGVRPVVQAGRVNWWTESARPGQGENIVLYGHSDDVFEELADLRPGCEIVLSDGGRDYVYIVTTIFIAGRQDGRWIEPTGYERLTLVTCAGDNNLIVLARPDG